MAGQRVWFVTGASSGLGVAIVDEALSEGDLVVATGRRLDRLTELWGHRDDVLILPLDVTHSNHCDEAIAAAIESFGQIDILVNNAGHGQVGACEETTDEQLREIFEVHFFGPAFVVKHTLPHMRKRKSGTIVQMSSMGGSVVLPGFGAYCASKFALEGYSEALAREVRPFGIRVMIVQPGSFRTNLMGSALVESDELAGYEDTVGITRARIRGETEDSHGDPAKLASALRRAIDDPTAPFRLPMGSDAVDLIREQLVQTMVDLTRWEDTARQTAFRVS